MQMPYTDTNAGLHYDLRLEIDPRSSLVSVSGSVAYHSPQQRLERARFYLHRQFLIHRIEGRRVLGHHVERGAEQAPPFFTDAVPLDIYFDPPLRANETTLIQFTYRGLISTWPADSPNIITSQWAELGHSLPWFPVQFDEGIQPFTYTLRITHPPEYGAASFGLLDPQASSPYFERKQPTTDIVVACGPGLRTETFESEANRVDLAASGLASATVAKLGDDVLWALERFSGWFGPTRPADFSLILSPRSLGGSYARPGLMVLAGFSESDYRNDPAGYLHPIACQAARGWWNQAPENSWENWLNASFAEYAALLVLRERYGEEYFERLLREKRARVQPGRRLWEFQDAQQATGEISLQSEQMVRDLGPMILHAFNQYLPSGRFLATCRACLWSGVADTNHLLDLVEELEGNAARDWLENTLKNGLKGEE